MKESVKVYRIKLSGPYDRSVIVELPIIQFGNKRKDKLIAEKEIRYFMDNLKSYCDVDQGYEILSVGDYIP